MFEGFTGGLADIEARHHIGQLSEQRDRECAGAEIARRQIDGEIAHRHTLRGHARFGVGTEFFGGDSAALLDRIIDDLLADGAAIKSIRPVGADGGNGLRDVGVVDDGAGRFQVAVVIQKFVGKVRIEAQNIEACVEARFQRIGNRKAGCRQLLRGRQKTIPGQLAIRMLKRPETPDIARQRIGPAAL